MSENNQFGRLIWQSLTKNEIKFDDLTDKGKEEYYRYGLNQNYIKENEVPEDILHKVDPMTMFRDRLPKIPEKKSYHAFDTTAIPESSQPITITPQKDVGVPVKPSAGLLDIFKSMYPDKYSGYIEKRDEMAGRNTSPIRVEEIPTAGPIMLPGGKIDNTVLNTVQAHNAAVISRNPRDYELLDRMKEDAYVRMGPLQSVQGTDYFPDDTEMTEEYLISTYGDEFLNRDKSTPFEISKADEIILRSKERALKDDSGVFNQFREGYRAGEVSNEKASLSFKLAMSPKDVFTDPDNKNAKDFWKLDKYMGESDVFTTQEEGFLKEGARDVGEQAALYAHGVPLIAGGALVGAMAGVPGIGWRAGSIAHMFEIETGHAYEQYRKAGVDHDIAKKQSIFAGLINAGIEQAEIELLLKGNISPAALTKKLFDRIPPKMLAKITTVLGNYGLTVGAETLQEGVQQYFTDMFGNLGAKEQNIRNAEKGIPELEVKSQKELIKSGIDEMKAVTPTMSLMSLLGLPANISKTQAFGKIYDTQLKAVELVESIQNNPELLNDENIKATLEIYKNVMKLSRNSDLLDKSGQDISNRLYNEIEKFNPSPVTAEQKKTERAEIKKPEVGRQVGSDIYVHKTAVTKFDTDTQNRVFTALQNVATNKQEQNWDNYDIIKTNADGSVSFIKTDDFDNNTEPVITSIVNVSKDGQVQDVPIQSQKIILDKHELVSPDYSGFNTEESAERSKLWRTASYNPKEIDSKEYFDKHIQKVSSKAQKIEPSKTIDSVAHVEGKEGIAKTEQGEDITFKYSVVSADDIVASHDTSLNINPNYPQELQPRERGRAASFEQINKIANNIEPEFLGENVKISDGAPVIGSDLIVESGNGRTIAIKKAYEFQNESSNKYKQWLIDNADKFGIDKNNIPNNPILVRVRTSDVDRAKFAKDANVQAVAAMSASEKAKSDAEKTTAEVLNRFVPNEEGDFNTAANRDFINAFVANVIPDTERGAYLTKDGLLSADGFNRVRNAITYKAYSDMYFLERMAESTDDNSKRVTKLLVNIAPKIVSIKEEVKAGAKYDSTDFSKDIVVAANKYAQLKTEGMKIKDYLDQTSFLDDGMSDVSKQILSILDENSKSYKKLKAYFDNLIEVIELTGNPNQIDMLGNEAPSKAELMIRANERYENGEQGQTNGQMGIFTSEKAQTEIDEKARRIQSEENRVKESIDKNKELAIKVEKSGIETYTEMIKQFPEITNIINDAAKIADSTKEAPLSNDFESIKVRNDIASEILKLGSFVEMKNKKEVLTGEVIQGKRIDFILGLPASGKSTLSNKYSKDYKARIIDADMVKERHPKYNNGFGSDAIHTESGMITEDIIFEKALLNGDNIVFPKVGKTEVVMEELINRAKEYGYTVHLHYVSLPVEKSAFRTVLRFLETGRFIKPGFILTDLGLLPEKTYDNIKLLEGVDSYEKLSNDVARGEIPILIERSEGWENHNIRTADSDTDVYGTRKLQQGRHNNDVSDEKNKREKTDNTKTVEADSKNIKESAFDIQSYDEVMDEYRNYAKAIIKDKDYSVEFDDEYNTELPRGLTTAFYKGSDFTQEQLDKIGEYQARLTDIAGNLEIEEQSFADKVNEKKQLQLKEQPALKVIDENKVKEYDSYKRTAEIVEAAKKNFVLNGIEIEYTDANNMKYFSEKELAEHGYEGYKAGYYQITGYTSEDSSNRKIVLNKGANRDTISEEIIHKIQTRLKEINPELNDKVINWEESVRKEAEKQNIEVPSGLELFAQAFVFGEMGWANENPRVANLISVDDDIASGFREILGEELYKAMLGQDMPAVSKSDRALKANKKTSSIQKPSDADIDSPEFKEWFSDSRVVDKKGNPQVVYHVTSENFDAFDLDKSRQNMDIPGFFFSPNLTDWAAMGDIIMPVYLSIKNPYAGMYLDYKGLGRDFKAIRKQLIADGYDGIIVNEDGEASEYIAFYPEQIKSVNNQGTWDINNPDIRFQLKEADINSKEFKEAFEGSKIVDESGKPLVVYHQSQSKDFDTFRQKGDRGYKRASFSQAGYGIYFSDNEELTRLKYDKSGGMFVKAYLDMKNPLDLGEYDAMYFDGTKVNYGDVVVENFKRNVNGFDSLPEPEIRLENLSKKAVNWLKGNGYDGVIGAGRIGSHKEYVVLDSSQIYGAGPDTRTKLYYYKGTVDRNPKGDYNDYKEMIQYVKETEDQLQISLIRGDKLSGDTRQTGNQVSENNNKDSGIKTHAIGISDEFRQKGYISLVGRKVKDAHELAMIAQVYRDPRYETLRIFYVKNNKIVGHEGLTSKVPGAAMAVPKKENEKNYDPGIAEMNYTNEINKRMKKLGADSWYMMHNHPSGDPTPSKNDLALTHKRHLAIPGFKGHVILDSNKYAVLEYDSYIDKVTAEIKYFDQETIDLLLTAKKPHSLLGKRILDADAIAEVAQELKSSKEYTTLVFCSTKLNIRAIQEIPNAMFNNLKEIKGYIRNRAREFGSMSVFAITHDENISYLFKPLVKENYLVDGVFITSKNQQFSERGYGTEPNEDLWMGKEYIGEKVWEPTYQLKPIPMTEKFEYEDSTLESFHKENYLKKTTLKEKLSVWLEEFKKMTSRTFEELDPNDPFNAIAIQQLVKYPKLKSISGDEASRVINDIIGDLNEEQYNRFERYVFLKSLTDDINDNLPLPQEWTPERVMHEIGRLEASMDEETKKAFEKRKELWDKIKNDYIESTRAIGFNTEKRFTKDNYFRHQVLDYMRAKNITGSGSKVRVNKNRGFLKERHGTDLALNENYIQAEYEVMTTMIYETKVAKMLDALYKKYDIKKSLIKQARENNYSMIQDIIDKEHEKETGIGDVEIGFSETEAIMKDFSKRIAIGLSGLKKMAVNNLLNDMDGKYDDVVRTLEKGRAGEASIEEGTRLFSYLAELADSDLEGNIQARMVFKAISNRKKFMQNKLGKAYQEWDSIIPEEYETHQPVDGKYFIMVNTISDKLAESLISGQLKENLNLSDMKVRKMMSLAGDRREYVIPSTVAKSINEVYADINRSENPVSKLVSIPMKYWKAWVLTGNPRQVLKYNLRNITGDLDGLIASAGIKAASTKYTMKASKELYDALKKMKFTKELLEWKDMGGFQTLMYASEIADVHDMQMFRKYSPDAKASILKKIFPLIPNTYFEFTRDVTDFREAILRYSAYLFYKEQLAANKGNPKFYGASIKGMIDGLPTTEEKAYQLSKDALGSYDEITAAGQFIRKYLIPFWSWNEVNFKRYKRIMQNVVNDVKAQKAMAEKMSSVMQLGSLTSKAALTVGRVGLRIFFLTTMLTLWNQLVHGDAEDDLPEDIRNTPHIVLGRNSKGEVIYFSRLGAINDIMEWFGLDQLPNDIKELMSGRKETDDFIKDMGVSPVNKFVNGLSPVLKTPMELFAGKSTYPDITVPSNIRDKKTYIAQTLGVQEEYKRLAGLPTDGAYWETWTKALVYKSNPESDAYYKILDLKRKYEKDVLKQAPTYAYSDSPKSKALYYYKLALKYGDKAAAEKYFKEYFDNGGTAKGIRQSLGTMYPLYGLTETELGGFVAWLTEEERETLDKAIAYYKDIMSQR